MPTGVTLIHDITAVPVEVDGDGHWYLVVQRGMRFKRKRPNGAGYVTVGGGGSEGLAHRYMYERFVGPIPPGYEVDHRCRVTACCNPAHLEAVTGAVNHERAHPVREACKRGHPFTDENTAWRSSGGRTWRECRECMRARGRKYQQAIEQARRDT